MSLELIQQLRARQHAYKNIPLINNQTSTFGIKYSGDPQSINQIVLYRTPFLLDETIDLSKIFITSDIQAVRPNDKSDLRRIIYDPEWKIYNTDNTPAKGKYIFATINTQTLGKDSCRTMINNIIETTEAGELEDFDTVTYLNAESVAATLSPRHSCHIFKFIMNQNTEQERNYIITFSSLNTPELHNTLANIYYLIYKRDKQQEIPQHIENLIKEYLLKPDEEQYYNSIKPYVEQRVKTIDKLIILNKLNNLDKIQEQQQVSIKRRMREVFRLTYDQDFKGYDFVMVARNRMKDSEYHQVEKSFKKAFKKFRSQIK